LLCNRRFCAGGDRSADQLNRLRAGAPALRAPQGGGGELRLVVRARLACFPGAFLLGLRLHGLLEEAQGQQGAHRGNGHGRRTHHHRPVIAFPTKKTLVPTSLELLFFNFPTHFVQGVNICVLDFITLAKTFLLCTLCSISLLASFF